MCRPDPVALKQTYGVGHDFLQRRFYGALNEDKIRFV
jgi:hypothetical protein